MLRCARLRNWTALHDFFSWEFVNRTLELVVLHFRAGDQVNRRLGLSTSYIIPCIIEISLSMLLGFNLQIS